MKYPTKEQTEKFIFLWNEENGFPQGPCTEPNMRYVKRGVVTWNEYDAPFLDLEQVKKLLAQIESVE